MRLVCIAEVHPVWRVKTLNHQLKNTRKRQRLADGIEIVATDEPDSEEPRKSATSYIALHHTLMIAFARAGYLAAARLRATLLAFSTDACVRRRWPLRAPANRARDVSQ